MDRKLPRHWVLAVTRISLFLAAQLTFSVFFPGLGSGQLVSGRVVDPHGEAISGTRIVFRGGETQTVEEVFSDNQGRFLAVRLSPGVFRVRADRLGYQTTESDLSVQNGDSIEIEISMAVEAIPLRPIVVTASSRPIWEHTEPPGLWDFWERKTIHERLGIGDFLTEEELKPLGGMNAAQAIADLSLSLQALQHSENPGEILLRGRLGCQPLIWVDGRIVSPRMPRSSDPGGGGYGTSQLIRNLPLGRGEDPISHYIHLSEIAAVEVYRGASDTPGEFRSGIYGSDCGAVVIWSKRR